MLSSPAMDVLTLMKLNDSLMEQETVQTYYGSLPTSLATPLDYIIVMSETLLCTPITLDMFLTLNFNRMTSMAFKLITVGWYVCFIRLCHQKKYCERNPWA